MKCQNCRCMSGFPCTGVAVARITYPVSGNTVSMCLFALNLSLDIADEEPDLEPAALDWLVDRRTLGLLPVDPTEGVFSS